MSAMLMSFLVVLAALLAVAAMMILLADPKRIDDAEKRDVERRFRFRHR